MINYIYKSIFAPHFKSFVRMKAAMGFTTPKIEYILKELDELFVVMDTKEPVLTREMIRTWRESRLNDSERTLYDKWSIISQFSRYMCHCGFISYVPRMPRQKDKYFIPKIFTSEEITRFFEAADNLRCNAFAHNHSLFSIPALFRTLYATGMRIGEAVNLSNEDVNFDKRQILIKKTKNQRQRIIPINPGLEKVLGQYVDNRSRMPIKNVDDPEAPFFINHAGASISKGSAYNWFRKVLKKCGIPFIGGNKGPRLHDLRHTFAVHSLMKQARAGKDIYCLLPILSVFMGHKTLAGTESYLRLTSEMFPELNLQIGAVSSYVFPSLEKIIKEEYEE
ncbi:MAG: tyrosine-type recombinase/integrase [Bacteroidales bacterium]|nr:tyrosine-type recombinase/integrase [Bacteroidales bacterium]